MKFSVKYPNVIVGDEPEPSILLAGSTGSCYVCKTNTNWVDIDFGVHVCSEECWRVMNEEFMEVFRK